MAEEWVWPHGSKFVIAQPTHQGAVRHWLLAWADVQGGHQGVDVMVLDHTSQVRLAAMVCAYMYVRM